MGILDDAIREHLDLKRQHGASEEDVKRQEEEVLGQSPASLGGQRPPASDELSELESLDSDVGPHATEAESFGPGGPPAGDPDELDSALEPAEPLPAGAGPEEIDPDEVLPEEALELEPSALPEPPPSNGAGASETADDWRGPEDSGSGLGKDDDLLEDTPEFLEEAPDQDRLWFEQKPPKDFDFDD